MADDDDTPEWKALQERATQRTLRLLAVVRHEVPLSEMTQHESDLVLELAIQQAKRATRPQ